MSIFLLLLPVASFEFIYLCAQLSGTCVLYFSLYSHILYQIIHLNLSEQIPSWIIIIIIINNENWKNFVLFIYFFRLLHAATFFVCLFVCLQLSSITALCHNSKKNTVDDIIRFFLFKNKNQVQRPFFRQSTCLNEYFFFFAVAIFSNIQ